MRFSASSMLSLASDPQVGSGGWMPMPRKLSVLSCRIALGMVSVAYTVIGPITPEQWAGTIKPLMDKLRAEG